MGFVAAPLFDAAGAGLADVGMGSAAYTAMNIGDTFANEGAMAGLSEIGSTLLPSASTSAVIGGGVKAIGQIQEGRAESEAASYNAEIAALNAATATKNAQFAGQIGEQSTYAEGMKTREQVGGIKANQAASGIDVNVGSAPLVRESAKEVGEQNALNAREAAMRSAYGNYQQAAADTTQASLDTAEAKQYSKAGNINAMSTLVNTASNPFLGYLQGKSITGE